MHRNSQLIGALVVVALALAASVRPSEAAVIYPWCANYGGRGFGASNCGFTTFDQCLVTIAGMGGSCGMNPWYERPPPPAPRSKRSKPR